MEELTDITDMELENIVLSKTTSVVKLAVLVQDKIANLNAHVRDIESKQIKVSMILAERLDDLSKGQQDMAEKVRKQGEYTEASIDDCKTATTCLRNDMVDVIKRLEALEYVNFDPTPAKCGTCGDTGIKVIGGDVGTMDCPDCQPKSCENCGNVVPEHLEDRGIAHVMRSSSCMGDSTDCGDNQKNWIVRDKANPIHCRYCGWCPEKEPRQPQPGETWLRVRIGESNSGPMVYFTLDRDGTGPKEYTLAVVSRFNSGDLRRE